MNHVFITYDLKTATQARYDAVDTAIKKSYPKRKKPLDTFYVVKTTDSPNHVFESVKGAFILTDSVTTSDLLVIDYLNPNTYSCWISQEVRDWLANP